MTDDEVISKLKDVFQSFKPFYPNYSSFLNKCKREKWFSSIPRKLLEQFYYNQEFVQVYQKPPQKEALKRKKGYYPKLVSFFPFERLYSDTGKIVLYPTTRKEAKKKEKPKPVQVEGIDEYTKNITQNGEIRFPKELRWVYPSGKQKSGNTGGNVMSGDLKRQRDEYIITNPEKFSGTLIKNAKARKEKNAY